VGVGEASGSSDPGRDRSVGWGVSVGRGLRRPVGCGWGVSIGVGVGGGGGGVGCGVLVGAGWTVGRGAVGLGGVAVGGAPVGDKGAVVAEGAGAEGHGAAVAIDVGATCSGVAVGSAARPGARVAPVGVASVGVFAGRVAAGCLAGSGLAVATWGWAWDRAGSGVGLAARLGIAVDKASVAAGLDGTGVETAVAVGSGGVLLIRLLRPARLLLSGPLAPREVCGRFVREASEKPLPRTAASPARASKLTAINISQRRRLVINKGRFAL
jgi:hypothetical protein